jgi:hypothetical protein
MGGRGAASAALLLGALLAGCRAEILTPPYFNLAEGKEIVASATCGVESAGPELYCQLVGANSDQEANINQNIIQGQVFRSSVLASRTTPPLAPTAHDSIVAGLEAPPPPPPPPPPTPPPPPPPTHHRPSSLCLRYAFRLALSALLVGTVLHFASARSEHDSKFMVFYYGRRKTLGAAQRVRR